MVPPVERLTEYIEDISFKKRAEISLQQLILSWAEWGVLIPGYKSGPKGKRDAVEELSDYIHSCARQSSDIEMNVDQSLWDMRWESCDTNAHWRLACYGNLKSRYKIERRTRSVMQVCTCNTTLVPRFHSQNLRRWYNSYTVTLEDILLAAVSWYNSCLIPYDRVWTSWKVRSSVVNGYSFKFSVELNSRLSNTRLIVVWVERGKMCEGWLIAKHYIECANN